ncbi:MAG TPA: translation initiation factor [Edaphocola sp.]|nr:translation initiation factor [Edaphocola sp.]
MSKQNKKQGLSSLSSLVYSTNPEAMPEPVEENIETLAPAQQKLRVRIDRKQRGGKVVTLVTGFIGNEDDLQDLGKKLKTKCGVGGTAKDGEIIIQGEYKQKVIGWLQEWGYKQTKAV